MGREQYRAVLLPSQILSAASLCLPTAHSLWFPAQPAPLPATRGFLLGQGLASTSPHLAPTSGSWFCNHSALEDRQLQARSK